MILGLRGIDFQCSHCGSSHGMRPKKLTGLYVEERGKLKGHSAGRHELSHLGIELSRLLEIFRVWTLDENVDRLAQFGHRGHGIAFFLIHMGQEFEERDATRPGSQIFAQQGFGQPEVLSPNRFIGEGLKCLPSRDKTA